LFCRLAGTAVTEVCYFRLGIPAGYVLHERPSNVWKHIVIGVAPFIANTGIGFFVGLFAMSMLFKTGELGIAVMVLIWLGISIAMHSFPSTGDARAIWNGVWTEGSPFVAKLVAVPFVGVIFLGAIASMFWFDALYGIAMAVVAPCILLG
jgi:hypothetical protein